VTTTCFAISAKRYALIRDNRLLHVVDASEEADDAPDEPRLTLEVEDLVDRSEHGLGLYLDPTNPEAPQRDEQDRRVWMSEAWDWILERRPDLPEWSASYALTRFTVSTARVQDWFRSYNKSLSRERWVRPGSFGLLAHASLGFGALPAGRFQRPRTIVTHANGRFSPGMTAERARLPRKREGGDSDSIRRRLQDLGHCCRHRVS